MDQADLKALEKIISTQQNIKIFGGVAMGMLLLVYFFTFPHLVDSGSTALAVFEAITTIMFIGFYFVGNQVSFWLTRLIRRGQAYRRLFAVLQPRDVVKDLNELKVEIEARRGA